MCIGPVAVRADRAAAAAVPILTQRMAIGAGGTVPGVKDDDIVPRVCAIARVGSTTTALPVIHLILGLGNILSRAVSR